jgi:hypothetical protein
MVLTATDCNLKNQAARFRGGPEQGFLIIEVIEHVKSPGLANENLLFVNEDHSTAECRNAGPLRIPHI